MGSAARYIETVKGTLQKFDEWYGPYPYDRITMVDPPHGAFQAGGMEYPTLITLDTSWFTPKSVLEPELVTEHEFGHQYWYGMVATNEFEEAWLDEGINSYTEVKIMDALYGAGADVANLPYGTLSEREMQRLGYNLTADTDPLTTPAWKFLNGNCLRRRHLRQNGFGVSHTGESHRRRHAPPRDPHLLHALSLYAPDGRRFPQNRRGSKWPKSAMVFRSSRLRHRHSRLRGTGPPLRSPALVSHRRQRRRSRQKRLPQLRRSAPQRRFHHARGRANALQERRSA